MTFFPIPQEGRSIWGTQADLPVIDAADVQNSYQFQDQFEPRQG